MTDAVSTPARPRIAARLYAARALRDFADGFAALILPVYLAARGFDAFGVGLVAALALFGSACGTLLFGGLSDRLGERTLLIAAALLMAATGLGFAAASLAAVVLVLALLGTINPSAGSASIFAPLEHALIAHAISGPQRTHAFALYSLVGGLAAAVGALAAAAPDLLVRAGFGPVRALELMFVAYSLIGLGCGAVYLGLPRRVQGGEPRAFRAPLKRSRAVVLKLTALFSVDAFAGGFAVQALMALWLFQKFDLSLAAAGAFFLVTGLLAALSQPVSGWLAARVGHVNTMVWTHLPANVALIGAALAPQLEIALALLFVRAALSQMDVPARSAYVVSVVAPEERAAAAAVTAVPRSLAAAASPAIAGALYLAGLEAWPLVLCGAIKIAYDLALLAMFRTVKPLDEPDAQGASNTNPSA